MNFSINIVNIGDQYRPLIVVDNIVLGTSNSDVADMYRNSSGIRPIFETMVRTLGAHCRLLLEAIHWILLTMDGELASKF